MTPNVKLMKAMGVPNGASTPTPPQQLSYFMTEAETDVNRLVAWAWEHTITVGHPSPGFDTRSPYCVDKDGKTLHIEAAAIHFDWDPGYSRRILRQARRQGRLRLDQNRRIWLCGEVKPCSIQEDDDILNPSGEGKENKKDCTRYVPGYILLEIHKRSKAERERILGEEAAKADLFDRWKADALNACRKAYAEDQDKRWKAESLPGHRKIKEPTDKQTAAPTVKITFTTDLVQSSDSERTVQRQNSGIVQSSKNGHTNAANPPTTELQPSYGQSPEAAPPIAVFRENNRENNNRPDRPDYHPDVVVVAQRLGVSKPRAEGFLAECRQESPGCELEDIAAVIDEKEATVNRKRYPNVTGVLLKAVPPAIAAYRKAKVRAIPEPLCSICSKPLGTGTAIFGAHFECAQQAKAKTA
jgi:hypothetical protein